MTEININELSEECKKKNQLFNVLIVLLSSCNQNCIHCYIPDHNNYGLPTDMVKKIINESRQLGALNVTFTGGEIFLRKDLFELIQFAKDKRMRVFLMSNASLLNENIIKKLYKIGIAEFSTTLFSMDALTHDTITQIPNSFKKTKENILLLKKYNIPVTVKIPLMEINKYAYREVEEFARENSFNFMSTTTIFSKSNGDSAPHELSIKKNLQEIIKETKLLQERYRIEEINYQKEGIPCGAGFNSISVNYDGCVWPCNSLFLKVGDVFKDSLVDIWNNSPNLKHWREKSVLPLSSCQECGLKSKCLRCPGMALLEDGDLYGCSSSAKLIAQLLQ